MPPDLIPAYAVPLSLLALALLVLLADVARTFRFVRYYHVPRADPVRVADYRRRMEAAYVDPAAALAAGNAFARVVTDAEFEASLVEFEAEMQRAGRGPPSRTGLFGSLDDAYVRVLRE